VYLGMVAMLDQCVAKVIEALRAAGLYDDAVIVFSSDHGEMLGSHRLFGKMCMYEEATRVPLMIKLPGQKRSRRVLKLTDHLDLAATLPAFGGAPAMRGSTGRSLKSIAEGTPSVDQRPHVFASYDGNGGRGFRQRMVRSTTHKLIWNVDEDVELYDLVEDPRETHNLTGNGSIADREAGVELRRVLNAWMDRIGDDVTRAP
jgi:choline-sulfatase